MRRIAGMQFWNFIFDLVRFSPAVPYIKVLSIHE
ncbi:hypothetical protein SAMN05428959_104367 [Duganella sp. CF517]|nr:hypothetical protein SAMN05428959_104367 [Duganella sp. CF517]